MDTMDPVYGAGTLLLIAAVAVAVLLVLIIALRMHAFVALVLVSFGTAIAAGVPVSDVPTISIAAFGSTLGTVALLVGLGVMIGRLLEVTGGAQVLADTLVSRFGEKRAPLALGVAALLFGLPIFFVAGLVVFLPIIFAVAKRFRGSVPMYALPLARQRLRLLAGGPLLRDGRQDHAAHLDGAGDHARRDDLRARPGSLGDR